MISASRTSRSRFRDEKEYQTSAANFENTQVEKYFVWNQIDRGGQGSVYRGWDPELQREVAIKIGNEPLHEDLSSFEEGVLLARIRSPHVADVYDTGVFQGYPFLVMEYVDGFNLHQVVSSRQLTSREIVRIITQVGQAVQSAHACGVLHLDLKPENVMLTSSNKVRLIDFGAGWRVPMHSDDLDDPGCFTEEFAAPEQVAGALEPVDVRTDVYGLSALLWFLVTGEPPQPWNAESQTRTVKDSRERHLLQVASRGLSDSRESRFQDADEFLRAINKRDRKSALVSIGVGILSLILGLMYSFVPESSVSPQPLMTPKIMTRIEVLAPPANELETYVYLWTPARGVQRIPLADSETSREAVHRIPIMNLRESFAVLMLTSDSDSVAVEQAAKLACGMSRQVLQLEQTNQIILDSAMPLEHSLTMQAIADCLSKYAKDFHLEIHHGNQVPSVCVNMIR